MSLPGVSTKKSINVEETLNTNPDLVILPLSLKDSVSQFEAVGVPTIVVNPESAELIEEAVTIIGKATGKEELAKIYNDYNKNKLDEIEKKLQSINEKPSVFLAGNSSFLSTVPKSYYQNEMIEKAGGISVSKDIDGTSWTSINKEQLLLWQPDFIVVVNDASYTIDSIKQDSTLAGLKAIENDKIFKMPSKLENWDTNNSSSTLGVLWLASLLHSDIYSKEEMKQDAIYFYETFYNFTPNDAVLDL